MPDCSALTAVAAVVLTVALFASAARQSAAPRQGDFYVSTDGNDAWSGRLARPNSGKTDGPFATLKRAREAVRKLTGKARAKDITVLIRGGTYRLSGPLRFGPEDGGTKEHSVTYAAYPGEEPIFSGGREIAGWTKSRGNLWTAELPRGQAGKWVFNELYVNGRRCTRARSPNRGFLRVVAAGKDNRTSFTFRPGDLKAYADAAEAEIVFLHDWSISRVRIKRVDVKKASVTLADPVGPAASHYTISFYAPHPRYFVENSRELLDSAGEWHLDAKAGRVSYLARRGEDMASAEAVAPAIGKLLVVKGDAAKGRYVENLRFVGLTFAHCAWPRPEGGYAGAQAGFHETRPRGPGGFMRGRVPAAVEFEAARGCAFEDGRIAHVGGTGISLRRYCRDNRIVGNEIGDVAGNGVMIGEPWANPPKAESVASGNRVSNNHIHHCGREFFGCVGVWVGITSGTVVSRNEIAHMPYTGVSVGWRWDTTPTPCGKNIIEFNHIHHVMEILSDGGGIYTLGRQPGTVLRGNLIHHVSRNAGRAESNGMFIDEGSSLILIEGNTIHDVARAPIRFHKATGNTIRGNTLVTPGRRKPFMFNACAEESMTFQANKVVEAKSFSPPEAGEVKAGLAPAYRKRLLGSK